MGGKSSTTTQGVSIPPEVLARYNAVNARAETAATTPFQQYSSSPEAFVAPLTSTQMAGISNTNTAAGQAQPFYQSATNQLMGAQNAAQPYYDAATGAMAGGQAAGAAGTGAAYGTLNNAYGISNPVQQAGIANMGQAYAGAQGYNQGAAQAYGNAMGAAQPFNQAATAQYYGGLAAAQPLQQASAQSIYGAQAGAQPFQQVATGLAAAGAQGVNAQQIGAPQIGQFMSPYIASVLQGTQGMLNQQNQQAMAGQTANAIQSGAFGGDRAGIAAANLSQQQQLANAKIYSDILNQGYGQSLAAAQQQQGVNLSAEQANRAALQQGSQAMLGIGQQGFGQGMTTAQQQAALAQQQFGQGATVGQGLGGLGQQVFGQGTSTGQNLAALGQQQYAQGMGLGQGQLAAGQQLYGQGANTAQQQAALAQQLFGQGAATSQQMAALGQGIYGTGAATSQALAGLGAGAQGSSLQGAQAQLAAGQTQQQTQQAGLQALYNQFLQQQSYPFQTAQFLANVAMGTGALSGNTTTTTQPGGFFSDERLKENVKEVGKTFDGQPIYSYNYKGGDKRQQIGLMAQEVEGKHPDAVGLAGGYKTVDYGKATSDAAKRGHFYAGGVASMGGGVSPENYGEGFADGGAPMGGYDPGLMQQIMQNYQSMYGTLAQPGQPGMLGSSTPGVGGIVPSANLAVPEMLRPADAPSQPSALDQASQIADLAAKGEQIYKSVSAARAKRKSPAPAPKASGGEAFAMGGMPYAADAQGGLTIPDETKEVKMLKPGDMPDKPESGLDKAAKVAQIAATVMSLSTGGTAGSRSGYEGGGAPKKRGLGETILDAIMHPTLSDNPIPEDQRGLAATNAHRADPLGWAASKGIIDFPYFGKKYETNKQAYELQDKINAAMSRRAPSPERPAAPVPTQRPTPRPSGLGAVDGAPPPAAPSTAQQEGRLGGAPVAPIAAAMPQQQTVDVASPQAAPAPQGLGGVMPLASHVQGADEAAWAGRHPFLSGAKDYLSKSENVLPLLAGLSAMGTAPTRSLGVALASGVGAGAKSYTDIRKQQAEVARTKAETAQSRAATSEAIRATRESIADMVQRGLIVVSPNDPPGTYVDPNTGQKWVMSDATGMIAAAFPSTTPAEGATSAAPANIYALPEQYAQKAKTSFVQANNLDPDAKRQNVALNVGVRDQGREEIDARPQLLNLMDAVGRGEDQSRVSAALATGPFASTLTGLFSAVNNAAGILGVKDANGNPIQLGQSDITSNTVMDKLGRLRAAASASGANQDSFGALEKFINSQPNSSLPKATNVHLTAQQMIQSQQAVDRMMEHEAFADAGGLAGVNRANYLGNDAEEVYRHKFTNDKYFADQAAIEDVMSGRSFPHLMEDLRAGRVEDVKRVLDAWHPGLSRYFIAGVR